MRCGLVSKCCSSKSAPQLPSNVRKVTCPSPQGFTSQSRVGPCLDVRPKDQVLCRPSSQLRRPTSLQAFWLVNSSVSMGHERLGGASSALRQIKRSNISTPS